MAVREWEASLLGQHLTGSQKWRLRLNGFELALMVGGSVHRVHVEEESTYRVQSGIFWTNITFYPGQKREINVDGLPNVRGEALIQTLNGVLEAKRLREDVGFLQATHETIVQWLAYKAKHEQYCIQGRYWFTYERHLAVMAERPAINVKDIQARLKKPAVATQLGNKANGIAQSLAALTRDHVSDWRAFNKAHTERELKACKDLFDYVESKPLTEEQARAVICFENRVQVVASAGSGKTSTMVAKAAYAMHRRFLKSEQIVLLAFNKQAAEELKVRADKSFARLGMQGATVEAATFHALGLSIIGKATGKKPDIPEWATDTMRGLRKLSELIDQLKDNSTVFQSQWDLFRFVFGKGLPAFGVQGDADVWDRQGNARLLTARGETVKSQEEAMIANWLFYNGVEYCYEKAYEYPTADADHRQYKPDFYYEQLGLYHEHFALDAKGVPPSHFENYMDGVTWKRQLHREKNTSLFETTSHGLRKGGDFKRLEVELTSRGCVLDPNPDRTIPQGGKKPLESAELISLVRTFISHVKSNCLTIPLMRQQLDTMPDNAFTYRNHMFLDIVAPVLQAWDDALAAEDGIDFEDMLNLAAGHLESGRYVAPYELVMADEFQDASRARARLCRALVQQPGRFLFAVGDDWQSINRFAGADVSVMTGFLTWFGHGDILKLEQTFRCPQALCDISSQFISKNPAQLAKQVRSVTPALESVTQAFQVDSKEKLGDAIDQYIMKLADGVRTGTIPAGRDGKVTVYILGRYNADRQYMPVRKFRFDQWVEVSFMTIHRSKGSEADYVILPELLSVLRGRSFPSTRTDDPVLGMAMPNGDTYHLGEERRLFYVALTRARRSVAMFTVRGQCSEFLGELVKDGAVSIIGADGETIEEQRCPACKQGVFVQRTGQYGDFLSCSNYPACECKPGTYRPSGAAFVKKRSARRVPFSA